MLLFKSLPMRILRVRFLRMNGRISLLFFLVLLSAALRAQDASFQKEEDSLRLLSKRIYAVGSEADKLAANAGFSEFLLKVLQEPGIYAWPFDSLQGIGCLRAPDNAFRIFNWNVPLINGSSRYFGFILLPGKKGQAGNVIVLSDHSDSIADATNQILPASRWYGVLYYSILKNVWKKQTIYTLLAWDGYSAKSSRKIIDILTFNPDGVPMFGMPVFKTADGLRTRVIFEYSRSAVMTLHYDNQLLVTGQRPGGQPKTKKTGMIVVDRLIPADARLKGQFAYYVPAGDTYDAFIFRQGFWSLAEDVMVNNPAVKGKVEKAKPIEYNLLPSRK